jgi:hypothetical protein
VDSISEEVLYPAVPVHHYRTVFMSVKWNTERSCESESETESETESSGRTWRWAIEHAMNSDSEHQRWCRKSFRSAKDRWYFLRWYCHKTE